MVPRLDNGDCMQAFLLFLYKFKLGHVSGYRRKTRQTNRIESPSSLRLCG
jgi:hypothetical protein